MRKKISYLLSLIRELTPEYVIQNTRSYFDEPPLNFYSGLLKFGEKNWLESKGYVVSFNNIVAGGSSYNSKPLAVLKCMAELVERFCLFCFNPKNIKYEEISKLKTEFVSPSLYDKRIKKGKFGFVEGLNLTKKETCLLPAQLTYLNYHAWAKDNGRQEPKFIQHISNGGSFGFDREETLINGIYELIERDSALTMYLGRVKMPRVDVRSIPFREVKEMSDLVRRYGFEIFLFNCANDLEVPAYISMAVDLSGGLPVATFGAKAELDERKAILGAMEESFMGRTWVRYELMTRGDRIPRIEPDKILTRLERAFYYAGRRNLANLDYLTNQKAVSFKKRKVTKFSSKGDELNFLLDLLKKKKISVYAVDIKPDFFEKEGFYAYRVIIPALQYLYLEEEGRNINEKRIEDVYDYFGLKKPVSINKYPHFLL